MSDFEILEDFKANGYTVYISSNKDGWYLGLRKNGQQRDWIQRDSLHSAIVDLFTRRTQEKYAVLTTSGIEQ